MYENGKQVNQYSAKLKHKNIQKCRYTPKHYSSYENYANAQADYDERWETFFQMRLNDEYIAKHRLALQKRKESGYKQPYERWWKCYSQNWKKNLKHFAHRESRQFNRDFCNRVLAFSGEIDDFDAPSKDRFNDPWDWD